MSNAQEPLTRQEILGPYAHPYRHVARSAWRHRPDLRRLTLLVPVLAAATAFAVSAEMTVLSIVTVAATGVVSVSLAGWAITIGTTARKLTRSWSQPSALGAARARRPHAGSQDPDGAHDEYAVTVEDDATLVTWRFRPLAIQERPGRDEIEVPGRPRYAASPERREAIDAADTTVAAEQLLAAQDRAAALEVAAAHAHERRLDASSTVAALQRVTGQRPG